MIYKFKTAIKALLLKAIDRVLINDLYASYHGMDFFLVLWNLDQDFFRHNLKYNPDKLSSKQLEILNRGREYLHELMEKWEVDFDHIE